MTSPVIDFKGICTALATRYTAANMGTPSGAVAIRSVHPQSAKGILDLPAIILEVQDGEVLANPGQWVHTMNIDVLLLIAKRSADEVRMETARQLYLPFLLHATVDQTALGVGAQVGYTLSKALPMGWEWDIYDVAKVEYEAIRVHVRVWVTENVVLTP